MTVRDILKMGDPRLLRVAQPVPVDDLGSQALADLLQDLDDTMRAAHGAGLAAPQIGVDRQVMVFGTGAPNPRYPEAPPVPHTVLLNPGYEALTLEEAEDWEGCLSVPGLRARVPRLRRIRYWGITPQGVRIERVTEDFHARVFQHEYDHLLGVLYPMRVRDFSHFGFTEVLFPGLDVVADD